MKINKIILKSFLALIVLLMISITIFGFAHVDTEVKSKLELFEKVDFSEHFSNIEIMETNNVTIRSGDKNEVIFYADTTREFIKPTIHVQNDTLFIRSNKAARNNMLVEVYVTDLKYMKAVSSSVNFNQVKLPELRLQFNHVTSRAYNKLLIPNLTVQMNSSNFSIHGTSKFDSIHVDIVNSHFSHITNSPILNIQGNASFNSKLRLAKSFHYNVNIDESSKLVVY